MRQHKKSGGSDFDFSMHLGGIDVYRSIRLERLMAMSLVIALHGVLIYCAWSSQLLQSPKAAMTLFVNLINPPPKKIEVPEPPKLSFPKKVKLDKPIPIEQPKLNQMLIADTPDEYEPAIPAPVPVVETTPQESVVEAAPVVAIESPKLTSPVMLSSELSLACPQRMPPSYPSASRRMGERGKVMLRVELDETGRIIAVKVKESSGYKRLDEAGLAAVKNWQCNAAMRDGEAVRAVALQPFDFILN